MEINENWVPFCVFINREEDLVGYSPMRSVLIAGSPGSLFTIQADIDFENFPRYISMRLKDLSDEEILNILLDKYIEVPPDE